ncbi:MAG TPA: hypothetical protein VKS78_17065 [Roseiarcus sp.]|nr:hypothetical protein [Roseiarcus sp.]
MASSHLVRTLLAITALASITAVAQAAPAPSDDAAGGFQLAANGCGYGFHRTPTGRCDNVRDYNASCQPGFHKVPTPSTPSGFRCVQDGY